MPARDQQGLTPGRCVLKEDLLPRGVMHRNGVRSIRRFRPRSKLSLALILLLPGLYNSLGALLTVTME